MSARSSDAEVRFWRMLEILYEAAGKPPLSELVKFGKRLQPQVDIGASTINDWLRGKSVPRGNPGSQRTTDSERYFVALVGYLQAKAHGRDGYTKRPEEYWRGMLAAAQRARGDRRGGRPSGREHVAAILPQSLPDSPKVFVGRNDALEKVTEALNHAAKAGSVVAIHAVDGMAGIGKTTLAVYAAHQLIKRGHFPDGQIFLRLHAHTPGQTPLIPAEALRSLLQDVGVKRIPDDADGRERLWRSSMVGKEFLLVLDDASGSGQILPLLPQSSAGSLVLITSRRRLTGLPEAVRITLTPLKVNQAAQMFVELSERPNLHSQDSDVQRVVGLCGHLPLAISLVVPPFKHHSAWTVADLADDLKDRKDRLAAMSAEDKSVSAAFELSYQYLSSDQQRFFRRLGLHPGTEIDAHAAAALDDTGPASARRHLNELFDYHLIAEPKRGHYRFHDLVRLFAGDLAQQDEPSREQHAAKLRLAEHFRTFLADHAGDDATLRAERENLMAYLDMCDQEWQGSDEREFGRILVETVNMIARFLGATASLKDRIYWGERALAAAMELEDHAATAQICCSTLAWALLQQGRHAEAESYSLQGLAASARCDDAVTGGKWSGNAARTLSGIARDSKDSDRALYWAEQALNYAQGCNDEGLKRGAALDFGYAALLRKDFQEAEHRFNALLALEEQGEDRERIGNRSGDVALAIMNRAVRLEDGLEKAELCQKARELIGVGRRLGKEIGHEVMIAESDIALAIVARVLGDQEEHKRLMASGKKRFKELGIRRPGRAEDFIIFP
ncbi:ATP-binding protein [Streptomyces sp. NPDC059010]|uniref:ATP-binding protein n=1 Tax=Streptomyces sp. NPDC059010 TaxID=3346695 RepID=UPI0036D11ABE